MTRFATLSALGLLAGCDMPPESEFESPEVEALQAQVAELEAEVAALRGIVGNATTSESTLLARVDALEAEIDEGDGDVTTSRLDEQDASLSGLDARVTALDASSEALESRVDAVQSDLDDTVPGSHGDRLATVEAELGAIGSDYATTGYVDAGDAVFQSQLDDHEERLGDQDDRLGEQESRIGAVESLVGADDGGRDLVTRVGDLEADWDPALADFADYLEVDTTSDAVSLVGANVYIQSGAGCTSEDCDEDGDCLGNNCGMNGGLLQCL
jgi:outer membrane murein-binding lipoprotein Lpp